jgi:hypothetical protein
VASIGVMFSLYEKKTKGAASATTTGIPEIEEGQG